MALSNLGGFKSIDEYVTYKLGQLSSAENNFGCLFSLMFSEKNNIFWEESDGYSIKKITYGESKQSTEKLSVQLHNSMQNLGISPGSVIGLCLPNSLKWIEFFWAILACGCEPLLLNTRMDREMQNAALRALDSAAVIAETNTFCVPTIIAADIIENSRGGQELSLTQEARCFGERIWFMSSGTSGKVKLCAYTPGRIVEQIRNAGSIIKQSKRMKKHYEGNIKQLTFLPFYHIFGLFAVYFWFAYFSRTFVNLPSLDPQVIRGTILRHKVTHIFAVPLFWNTVLQNVQREVRGRRDGSEQKLEKGLSVAQKLRKFPLLHRVFAKFAFKSLRTELFGESPCFCITGGSAISTQTLNFFNDIGYHLANGYGMSEIGITSVELSENPETLASQSVGRPFDSVHYSLSPDGELIVSGMSVADEIRCGNKVLAKGQTIVKTGDIASLENNAWRILGRVDDQITTYSGENLQPDGIEEKLYLSHGAVPCIIKAESRAVLLISTKPYYPANLLESIRREAIGMLSDLNLSSEFSAVVLIADPLTAENEIKPNRRKLAESYLAGCLSIITPTSGKAGGEASPTERRIAEIIAAYLGCTAEEVAPHANFFSDMGISSLDYYTITSLVGSAFELSINESAFQSLNCVSAMVKYIEDNMK